MSQELVNELFDLYYDCDIFHIENDFYNIIIVNQSNVDYEQLITQINLETKEFNVSHKKENTGFYPVLDLFDKL